MQHHIQTLVKHIFSKESLQEVTVNQLQQFIDDYPYSAIGQLLLAKKLRDTGAQNFDEQGGKTSLYFHDPVWAGWVLRDKPVSESVDEMVADAGPVNEQPHFVFNNIPAADPVIEETGNGTETPPWEETQAVHGTESPAEIAQPEPLSPEQEADFDNEKIVEDSNVEEEVGADENVQPASSIEEIGRAEEIVQSEPNFEGIIQAQEDTQPEANIEAIVHEEESVQPEPVIENVEPVTHQPEAVQQPAPPEAGRLADTPAPSDSELNFEPYHTIDYFASLGIKLKPEELAKDKLGQQLKSFTDWLRSMKKLTPTEQAANATEVDDLTTRSIQRIAEFSNEAKEIITEAMAEVWAKQGHRAKAIEIYEKLSLLNPAKSHYFASRIEALKS